MLKMFFCCLIEGAAGWSFGQYCATNFSTHDKGCGEYLACLMFFDKGSMAACKKYCIAGYRLGNSTLLIHGFMHGFADVSDEV